MVDDHVGMDLARVPTDAIVMDSTMGVDTVGRPTYIDMCE